MKKLFILVNVAFFQSCATSSETCDLAPPEEGWKHIEKQPSTVRFSDKPSSGNYYEWFANDSGLYMRCERAKESSGCVESARFYNSETGERALYQEMEELLIVCGM